MERTLTNDILGQTSNGPRDTKGYNFLIPEPNFKTFVSNYLAISASKQFAKPVCQTVLEKDTLAGLP